MTFENGIARAAARMMDRRKFVTLSAAAAFSAALGLSGCASGEGAKGADASDGAVEFTATTESRDGIGRAVRRARGAYHGAAVHGAFAVHFGSTGGQNHQ